MQLKVMTPTQKMVDRKVDKVIAEAIEGSFCVLPNHVDVVAGLVPGLLEYESGGNRQVLAVDTGVLVKCAEEVLVSVRSAVEGDSEEQLQEAVRGVIEDLDERERKARSTLARLEADFVSHYYRLQEEQRA